MSTAKAKATKIPKSLKDITKMASDFVNENKGRWNKKQFQDFVGKVRKKGYDTTEDFQGYLHKLVEAMKKFYHATKSTDGVSKALKSAASDTAKFVSDNKGMWGKKEWKEFSKTFQSARPSLPDEAKDYLNGVVDASKVFYAMKPAKKAAKKSASKAKAKVKKAKAKKAVKKSTKKASAKKATVKKAKVKKAKAKKAVKKAAAKK